MRRSRSWSSAGPSPERCASWSVAVSTGFSRGGGESRRSRTMHHTVPRAASIDRHCTIIGGHVVISTEATASGAEAVRRLLPLLRERAQEAETARRLPRDVATRIAEAGVFRLGVPKSLGGAEAPLPELLETLEAAGHRRQRGRLVRDDRRHHRHPRRAPAFGLGAGDLRTQSERDHRGRDRAHRARGAGRRRRARHRHLALGQRHPQRGLGGGRHRLPNRPTTRRARGPTLRTCASSSSGATRSRSPTTGTPRGCAAPAATRFASRASACRRGAGPRSRRSRARPGRSIASTSGACSRSAWRRCRSASRATRSKSSSRSRSRRCRPAAAAPPPSARWCSVRWRKPRPPSRRRARSSSKRRTRPGRPRAAATS